MDILFPYICFTDNMDLSENIQEALRAVKANRVRAFLTMLIIAFGIMAIVGVLTAIEGMPLRHVRG